MPSLSNWVIKHSEIKRQPTFFFTDPSGTVVIHERYILANGSKLGKQRDSDYLQ